MRRREFLTGAAALAAYAHVRDADALAVAQRLVLLGGARASGNLPMPSWATAKAAVTAGTRNAKLLFVGDSLTAGAYANGNSNEWGGAKALSYPSRVVAALANAKAEGLTGAGNLTVNQAVYDPRFSTLSGAWSGSTPTLGAQFFLNTTTTDPIVFQPNTAALPSYDTIEMWINAPVTGLGSIDVSANGSGLINVPLQNATAAFKRVVVTVPLGSGPVTFTPHTLPVVLGHFNLYNSAVKQISAYMAGWSGGNIANMSGTSQVYDSLNAIKVYAPDLTIIMQSTNDWLVGAVNGTYTTNLQALVTAAKLSGDVILISDPPSDFSLASQAQQIGYNSAIQACATSNGLNFINMTTVFGSYLIGNANGFYSNTVHLNAAGYQVVANAVLPFL